MAFSYFFRDFHSPELVVRHMVPWIRGRSHIRIWDTGCAMGQETYTLAMLLAEQFGSFAFKNIRILATDIDISHRFEQTIRNGIYPIKNLKRIPSIYFSTYFHATKHTQFFQVINALRDRIAFVRHDLLSLAPPGDGFSLVVCKNVLLRFTPAVRRQVIGMFHRVLMPGGYLLMEQTQRLQHGCTRLFSAVTKEARIFRKNIEATCELSI